MKIDLFVPMMTKKYTEKYRKINPAVGERAAFRSTAVVDLEVRLRPH